MPTKPAAKQTEKQPEKQPSTLEEALLMIDELRASLAQEKAKNQTVSGWIVITPNNPRYSDCTAGIWFRNGRAFIPDGKQGEEKARILLNDFGYTVNRVEALEANDPMIQMAVTERLGAQ